MTDTITLSMGSGGRLSAKLTEDVFLNAYGNEILHSLDDSAEFEINQTRFAFTTDSYTIKPVFFPGGDIGKLALCGTINDLTAKGAIPYAVSAGFIIEEGFPIDVLKRIAQSMRETSEKTGVKIVTGDTKVVGRGEADGIFINTSGIGIIADKYNISSKNARPGDDIIVTGTIGDHGISIMNVRENLEFIPQIQSDVSPLNEIAHALGEVAPYIHVMRDPTRGGVASTLNEIAKSSGVNIKIFEDKIPVGQEVRRCCDLLGMDPLYIANEGKMVIFSDPQATKKVLDILKSIPVCRNAGVFAKVEQTPYSENVPPVCMVTGIGTSRFVPLLEGEHLPRIC